MTQFDKVIPPGSEGKVIASVDITHIKGPVEKAVDLETNDPEQTRAKVSIKANVKTVVDVRPMEQVRFNVSKGQTQTVDLVMTPTYEKPVKITNATVDSDVFDVKLEPPAGGSKDYKLKVSIKETAKIGNPKGTVKVGVEGAPQTEIRIPVMANVKGPISFNPSQVSFQIRSYPQEIGTDKTVNIRQSADATSTVVDKASPGSSMRVLSMKDDWYQVITPQNKAGWVNKKVVKVTKEPQTTTSQTISVTKTTGNFKILEYTSNLQDVKVEMDPSAEEKNQFNLRVSLPRPDDVKKQMMGKIVIKTNDSEQPELTIPVYIHKS